METSHVKLGSCYLFAGKGPVWNSQETWSAYLLRIQTHSHISHGKPLESNYQKKTKHIIKHHHHHITIKHHHTLAMIALNSVLLRENEAPTKILARIECIGCPSSFTPAAVMARKSRTATWFKSVKSLQKTSLYHLQTNSMHRNIYIYIYINKSYIVIHNQY